jgi:hypothetical protein
VLPTLILFADEVLLTTLRRVRIHQQRSTDGTRLGQSVAIQTLQLCLDFIRALLKGFNLRKLCLCAIDITLLTEFFCFFRAFIHFSAQQREHVRVRAHGSLLRRSVSLFFSPNHPTLDSLVALANHFIQNVFRHSLVT